MAASLYHLLTESHMVRFRTLSFRAEVVGVRSFLETILDALFQNVMQHQTLK